MKKYELFIREKHNELPKFPQPFYANSIGIKRMSTGEESFSPGMNNSFIELVWSVSGTGEIDFHGKKYPLKANDVFFFLPDEDHLMRSTSAEWISRWLCFDGPLAVANFMAYRFPRLQHVKRKFPVQYFDEIADNINSRDVYVQSRIAALIMLVLSTLVDSNNYNDPDRDITTKCVEYIKKNYSDPQLGIDKLCKTFGVCRSSLVMMFRRDIKQSIGFYIANLRRENAYNLLRGTQLSIKEVAVRCGYLDLNSFSRMIRKTTGMKPTEIRAKSKTGQRLIQTSANGD